MKRSILIIGGALMFTFASCGSKSALDINPDELDSACDFVDALEQVVDEMNVIVEDGELATDEEELFKKLENKAEEISDVAESKYERSEAEQCPNWDAMREKSEKVQGFL